MTENTSRILSNYSFWDCFRNFSRIPSRNFLKFRLGISLGIPLDFHLFQRFSKVWQLELINYVIVEWALLIGISYFRWVWKNYSSVFGFFWACASDSTKGNKRDNDLEVCRVRERVSLVKDFVDSTSNSNYSSGILLNYSRISSYKYFRNSSDNSSTNNPGFLQRAL